MVRTPALPEDLAARLDFCSRDKLAKNSITHGESNPHHEQSAANGERGSRISSARKSFASKPSFSSEAVSPETIAAPKTTVCCIIRRVFSGAFCPSPVPPNQCFPAKVNREHPTQLNDCSVSASAATPDGGEGGGSGPDGPAVAVAHAAIPVVQPPSPPSDRYFFAYGHCLLAGAGTGARDEAKETVVVAAGHNDGILGPSIIGDFSNISTRARTSAKSRTRGYGDALEVFQEGLRRFPTSTALLYGASLAMQASMRTCI